MSGTPQEAIDYLCESLCERLDHQTAAIDDLRIAIEDLTFAVVTGQEFPNPRLSTELFEKRRARQQKD